MGGHEAFEKEIVDYAKTIFRGYPQYKEYHDSLIREMTERAQASPIYAGRVSKISGIGELNELPLLFYDRIFGAIKQQGLDAVLLAKPAQYWQTSGYTGEPKRFYYSTADVDHLTSTFAVLGYAMGVRPWTPYWNFGARDPLLSNKLFEVGAEKLKIEKYLSTPLGSQADFFEAMRRASKGGHFDVATGTPLLYMLMARVANDPSYAESVVLRAVKAQIDLPTFLAKLIVKYLLRGVDYNALKRLVESMTIGLSYTEPIAPNIETLSRYYPKMRFFDCFGSTEAPVQGIQIFSGRPGFAYLLTNVIPEMAKPEDILNARKDPSAKVTATPWTDWRAGMRGELVITRPGECLPLIRYPTGDIIEVIDPACEHKVKLDYGELSFTLPVVKFLGRSVDLVDFEVSDEKGDFLGGRIYSSVVNEHLLRLPNIRWWEFYKVGTVPAKLVFVIIPEKPVGDEEAFRSRIIKSLNDVDYFLSIGLTLDLVKVVITKPSAYRLVEEEIDRRVRSGRSLGQLKPRRVMSVANDDELNAAIREKVASP